MNALTIISAHTTLAEAVAASGIDLSYNPEVARRAIQDADAPCRRAQEIGIQPTIAAFVVVNAVLEQFVVHTYMAQGIRFLRRFTPFVSALDNRDLTIWERSLAGDRFSKTNFDFPNNKRGREACAKLSSVCSNFYVASL